MKKIATWYGNMKTAFPNPLVLCQWTSEANLG